MNANRENGETSSSTSSATSGLVNSVDQMVRWPLQMTGATWDLMMQGMRSMTGTGRRSFTAVDQSGTSSSTSRSSIFSGQNDQDLGGDDLKFVVWSIVFTKPGYECVLEPQQSEIVNYSADGASFAAVKIAKLLEKARHGHVDKAESWEERGYPPESKAAERRTEAATTSDHGWRIPADDQKYITFLYRVDWRLPKQEEVTRVERVTIERGGTTRVV